MSVGVLRLGVSDELLRRGQFTCVFGPVELLKGKGQTMKKRIQVLQVETRKGAKSGKEFFVAQCVLHGDDGQVKVGELTVFNPEVGRTMAPGDYQAEFDVRVDFDRRLTAELIALHPVSRSGVAQSSAQAKS